MLFFVATIYRVLTLFFFLLLTLFDLRPGYEEKLLWNWHWFYLPFLRLASEAEAGYGYRRTGATSLRKHQQMHLNWAENGGSGDWDDLFCFRLFSTYLDSSNLFPGKTQWQNWLLHCRRIISTTLLTSIFFLTTTAVLHCWGHWASSPPRHTNMSDNGLSNFLLFVYTTLTYRLSRVSKWHAQASGASNRHKNAHSSIAHSNIHGLFMSSNITFKTWCW